MAPDSDTTAPAASSLRGATWTTPVVLAGLFVLLIWRSVSLLHHDWLTAVPWWLLLIVTAIIPQMFLLIYPLVTRKQPGPNRFHLPGLKRLLIEAGIAVAIIFGCILLISVVQYVLTQVSPETSLTPKAYDHMARSTGTPFIYAFLLASFLYGPIAEEIFFRGFLFNAFRKRMPLAVAMLLQSAIFGFMHFFSVAHSIMAALLGLVLSLVYYWRKTIVAPLFVHVGFNALAALGVFLAMHANANAPALGVMHQASATECVIGEVTANSPAESAGLLPDDRIVRLNDHPITSFRDLIDAITHYEAGDSVVLTVDRDGQALEIRFVLTRRAALSRP